MRLLAFVSILLVVLSCKKSNDKDHLIPAGSKVTRLELYDTSTQQEWQIVFAFDQQQRVNGMHGYVGPLRSTVLPADSLFYIYYSYRDNNSLPYKITSRVLTQAVQFHDLTYDGQNRLIRDSIYSQNASSLMYYRYLPGYMIAESGSYRDSFQHANGNYIFSAGRNNAYTKAEFDNQPNPLNYFNVSQVFHVLCGNPNGYFFDYWTATNRNNQTLVLSSTNRNFSYTSLPLKHVYTYLPNGLPDTKASYYGASLTQSMKYHYE
jgi:hypothetical protein